MCRAFFALFLLSVCDATANMTRPSDTWPDITQLTQLASRNNVRVNQALDSLTSGIDSLVDAAGEQRWSEVITATEEIKRSGKLAGLGLVCEAAEDLLHTITRGNDTESLRRVIRLIGAAGQTRRKITRRVQK